MHLRKNKEEEKRKEKSKAEGNFLFEFYLSELLRLEGLRNRKVRQAFVIQDNFKNYACDLCKFKTIIRKAMLPHRQHEHQIKSKYKYPEENKIILKDQNEILRKMRKHGHIAYTQTNQSENKSPRNIEELKN